MSVTDPIADMLTRIRNAIMVRHDSVSIPLSNMKRSIAADSQRRGLHRGFRSELRRLNAG